MHCIQTNLKLLYGSRRMNTDYTATRMLVYLYRIMQEEHDIYMHRTTVPSDIALFARHGKRDFCSDAGAPTARSSAYYHQMKEHMKE